MPKYYRVRTQEQWDWLMQKLEKENDKLRTVSWFAPERKPTELTPEIEIDMSDVVVFVKEPECLEYGTYEDFMNSDRSKAEFNFIEVSQMMEEKMENYVTIQGEDLKNIEMFRGDESKGNLREFWDISKVNIPKSLLYPKVRMSVAEKKEFDELKDDWQVLICAFDAINEIDYPRWFSRLNDYPDDNDEHQLDFARAWADESLIEVIPDKKWNVRVPAAGYPIYYYKLDGKLSTCMPSPAKQENEEDVQFTVEELKHYGLEDESIYKREEVSK